MNGRRWLGWGASVVGPAHRRAGIPNQDAWMARRLADGVAVAVSDGIGSCAHAEAGSRAACRAVLAAASRHLCGPGVSLDGMPSLVREIWPSLLAGRDPLDCSATCLFVAVRPEADALLAQLGDGLIAACAIDGTVDLLAPDKNDSFANVTVGLASDDAAVRWRTMTVPEERYLAFVLCTDGIADDLESSSLGAFAREVAGHYRSYSRRARRHDVLRWLRAWPVVGHTDDKTIACLHRIKGDA